LSSAKRPGTCKRKKRKKDKFNWTSVYRQRSAY
jgi:hypothetical protein